MADPWLKFFPTDWRSDPALRMCGIAARGLWIEMIALMHEATPYGHLLVAGRSPTDAQLAVLVGAPSDQIPELLGELDAAGVFSRTREGVIYSRKMTRTAKKAAVARKNGKMGGNPTLCNSEDNPALVKGSLNGRVKTQKPEARSQIPESSTTTVREGDPVVVDDQSRRRDEVLRLMGLDGVIRPDGRFTGQTVDMAEMPKWDALGLTKSEQDAKIREMLIKQRAKDPGFFPNRWSWFTAGMTELAASKQRTSAGSAPPAPAFTNPEAEAAKREIDREWAAIGDRADREAEAMRHELMDRYRNLKAAAGI